jgi:hypothetical protein
LDESNLEKFEEILERQEDFAPPFQIAELDKSFYAPDVFLARQTTARRRSPGYRFESKKKIHRDSKFNFRDEWI